MATIAGSNRHITFDEDEDFEDVPTLEPLSQDNNGEVEEEDGEDSDSDAAPEEATISGGKEDAQKRVDSVKSLVQEHRQQVKEKRKQQHEKNRLQQEEKRKRLEERRLPQSVLDAFAAQQKARPQRREQTVPVKKKKKLKKLDDSDGNKSNESVKNVDEDGLITIDTMGVKIRTLNEETKKYDDVSRRAAEFRMNALYGRNIRRMPTAQIREMREKRMKSGKAVFASPIS